MEFKDTRNRYGIISRFLHWTIALLILNQFCLVYAKQWFLPDGSQMALFYINGLHKPIGVCLFFLVLFAIFWQILNIHPQFPSSMSKIQKILARTMHGSLLLVALGMSSSGFLMSGAAGYPTNLFGWYQLPAIIEVNRALAQSFFQIHETLAILMAILIVLHVLAALAHHFFYKDNILNRMLGRM